MWTMILKRLFRGLLTMIFVVVLIFALLRIAPGDPAAMMAGEYATEERIEEVREEWGLNEPITTQFFIYVKALLTGDAGMSYQYTMGSTPIWSVTSLVLARLPYTLALASAAMLINILVAIPLGVITALKPNSWLDNFLNAFNFVVLSFPVFFLGIMMMFAFGVHLKILPTGGTDSPLSIILPAATLSMHFNVTLMRMTRTEVGRNLQSDYIRVCRAKGLSSIRTLFIHGLRNAAIPLVTLIGLRFGAMMGGAVVVETLFRWPGIGNLLITSVQARDYPTVQFLVPYVAFVFIVINLIVDILYGVLDPRIHRKA